MDVKYQRVHGKPRLHVSINLLFGNLVPRIFSLRKDLGNEVDYLEYGRHVARLQRRRRRRAYASTSNTAAHYNHEKNQLMGFFFLYGYGAPIGGRSGRWSSAIILRYNNGYKQRLGPLVPKQTQFSDFFPVG